VAAFATASFSAASSASAISTSFAASARILSTSDPAGAANWKVVNSSGDISIAHRRFSVNSQATQIEMIAKMFAVIAEVFDNPINREYYFMMQGEASDDDSYGLYSRDSACRWDLEQGI